MRRPWLLAALGLLVAILTIGAVACGDSDGGGDPTATAVATAVADATTPPDVGNGASTTVEVNLLEFQLIADAATAPAGTVSFAASNIGGANHELLVLRTDLAADALPTNDDGSADESGDGVEVVGETSELTPSGSETLDLDLEAGSYVLMCNIVDTSGAHYGLGMAMAFEVTE